MFADVWNAPGVGETTAERLTRICALPNRVNNPKCINFRQGILPPGATTVDPAWVPTSTGGTIVTMGPTSPPIFSGDVVTPGKLPPMGSGIIPAGSASAGGGGLSSIFSAVPTWLWIAGGGLLVYKMVSRK